MQASLLTGLSCWAQRGSAFLCSCAQIMEPSIRSLEPVNRSPLCGRGETNFKANQKEKKKKKKNPKLWHIYQIRSGSEHRDRLYIQKSRIPCIACATDIGCVSLLHAAKPVFKHFLYNYLHVAKSFVVQAVSAPWALRSHFSCFLRVYEAHIWSQMLTFLSTINEIRFRAFLRFSGSPKHDFLTKRYICGALTRGCDTLSFDKAWATESVVMHERVSIPPYCCL